MCTDEILQRVDQPLQEVLDTKTVITNIHISPLYVLNIFLCFHTYI